MPKLFPSAGVCWSCDALSFYCFTLVLQEFWSCVVLAKLKKKNQKEREVVCPLIKRGMRPNVFGLVCCWDGRVNPPSCVVALPRII